MIVDTFSPTLIFPLMFNFFLLVHSSLRNFVYRGIHLIASNSGMLTSTFQKVSKISCSDSSFLAFANLSGNGGATRFLVIGKMGLPLNSILGASKIAGSVFSLLFFVSVDSSVEVGSIFTADSGVTAGWVVCTAVAAESGSILSVVSSLLFLVGAESDVVAGSMVCTTVAVNPGIAAGRVVCTTVADESNYVLGAVSSLLFLVAADSSVETGSIFAADSSVETGSIFAADSGFAAGSTTTVEFRVAAGGTLAVDYGVATGSMVCTSLPLLKVMSPAFSLGLISA
jgi:hypothetical protein